MAIQFFTQPEGKVTITARGGHAFLRNIKPEHTRSIELLLVEIENEALQLPTVAEIHAGFEKAGCERIELSETNIAFGPPPENWLALYRGEDAAETVESDSEVSVDPEVPQTPPADSKQEGTSVEQNPISPAETEGEVKQEGGSNEKAPETEEEFRAALTAKHPDEADTFKDLKLDELKALWEVSQA
jgi:hypothetical protein